MKNDVPNPQETRQLALAVVQVLQLWSNTRYTYFLLQPSPDNLTTEWFRWFVGEWNVARTIKDGKREIVREYLNSDFRRKLMEGGGAEVVDAAAEHIEKRGWSSQKRKNGQGSLPISLVSKVGFFLCPSKLVPLDRYAVKGVNNLRRDDGARRLKSRSYQAYLEAFDNQYAQKELQLAAALKEPWAKALAIKLGCTVDILSSIAMRRKLFDAYLMHSGDYRR